jgi:hypothetical protein
VNAGIRKFVLRALAIVVVAFAGLYLWRQWQSASREQLRVSLDVPRLLFASVIVLATYALLIETWRRVLAVYGSPVSFVDAAMSGSSPISASTCRGRSGRSPP